MEPVQSPAALLTPVHGGGAGAVGGASVTDSRIAISAKSVPAAPTREGAARVARSIEPVVCPVAGCALRLSRRTSLAVHVATEHADTHLWVADDAVAPGTVKRVADPGMQSGMSKFLKLAPQPLPPTSAPVLPLRPFAPSPEMEDILYLLMWCLLMSAAECVTEGASSLVNRHADPRRHLGAVQYTQGAKVQSSGPVMAEADDFLLAALHRWRLQTDAQVLRGLLKGPINAFIHASTNGKKSTNAMTGQVMQGQAARKSRLSFMVQ